MKIKFTGAAQRVTGSSTILEINNKKILIDCGLEQGEDEKYSNNELLFNPLDIDLVVLTHAHLDHSGKLPLLVKNGYNKKIYCTIETLAILKIMLLDSASIQEREKELYNKKDAIDAFSKCVCYDYNEKVYIDENISFTFVDAGHLFGSASIIFFVKENNIEKTIVFSGDIGNKNQPLIKDPALIDKADVLIIESTYGDKNHTSSLNFKTQEEATDYNCLLLSKEINRCYKENGNVIIPAFSIGRTQEIIYLLHIAMLKGYIDKNINVFVDSPLSSKATKIFSSFLPLVADKQCKALLDKGIDPLSFETLCLITSVDDSKKLNYDKNFKVIISSSGMCTSGRVKYHLLHNLSRKESTIIFCGYQANKTLGRQIVNKNKYVNIFNKRIRVNAKIVQLHTLSGHTDQKGLLDYISSIKVKPQIIFVNHGGKNISQYFASLIVGLKNIKAVAPKINKTYDLDNINKIKVAKPTRKEYKNYRKVRKLVNKFY